MDAIEIHPMTPVQSVPSGRSARFELHARSGGACRPDLLWVLIQPEEAAAEVWPGLLAWLSSAAPGEEPEIVRTVVLRPSDSMLEEMRCPLRAVECKLDRLASSRMMGVGEKLLVMVHNDSAQTIRCAVSFDGPGVN